MAIEKKLICFARLEEFERQLAAGNILDYSIVFIQDAKKIWNRGTYYDCSTLTEEEISAMVKVSFLNKSLSGFPMQYEGGTYGRKAIEATPEARVEIGEIDDYYYGSMVVSFNDNVQEIQFSNITAEGLSCGTFALFFDEDTKVLSLQVYYPQSGLFEWRTYHGKKLLSSEWVDNSSITQQIDDLSEEVSNKADKSDIPSAVTESTISEWGFTKNTGTYSKPNGGIPKSDLASAVQTSLGKADTALQSYTEQYKGTVTGVKMNGASKGTSGVVDLGNVVTSVKINGLGKTPSNGVVDLGSVVTDVSGKQDALVSGTNIKTINGTSILGSGDITIEGGSGSVTDVQVNGTSVVNNGVATIRKATIALYGVTKISTSLSSTSNETVPTSGTIKKVYDLANGKQDALESGTNIKTINGESILGSGNISISGGSGTITGVSANGTSVATSGIANIPAASTSKYGVTKLNSSTSSTSTTEAATPSAVKSAYDLANSYKGTVTGVKINGTTKSPSSGTVDIGNVVTSIKINGSTKTPSSGVVDLGTISGGGSSSGSGAYSEVNHGTSDTTFTLTPNTFHVWDEVSALTLTLGSETAGVANEYLFQFNSGATATSLTLPDDIKWANDSAPTIEPNMIYQVSILKGLASVLEFSNTPSIEMISFSCMVDTLQAEAGMTWAEWINSSYNNGKYTSDGNRIVRNNDMYVTYQGAVVYGNEIIIDGAFYNIEPM